MLLSEPITIHNLQNVRISHLNFSFLLNGILNLLVKTSNLYFHSKELQYFNKTRHIELIIKSLNECRRLRHDFNF